MVSSHVWLSPYSRKSSGQTAGDLVRYFKRQGQFNPEDYFRRTGKWAEKYADYVDDGTQNLPAWAKDEHGKPDPGKFFAAARQHESADRWYWGFQVEFSLPRELSHEQQMALREDFMAATMPHLPALWVMHNKRLPSGEMHPHVHILLSARQVDGIDRDEVQTFKLWQRAHPEQGGAPRDIFWSKKHAPEQLRQAFADISNYHLERAGVLERLDARSLERQGNNRQAIRREAPEIPRPDAATKAREQEKARKVWERRKERLSIENIWAISREGMVAHVHDWTRNVIRGKALERSSPEVVLAWLERDAHRLTTEVQGYERELYQVGRQRMVLEYRERGEEVDKHKRFERPLVGNRESKIFHVPGDHNYGDVAPRKQELFWTIAEAEAAGYRAAVNQHYGAGAEQRKEALERATRERERRGMGQRSARTWGTPRAPSSPSQHAPSGTSLRGVQRPPVRETLPVPTTPPSREHELEDITVPTMAPEKPHGRAVRTRVFDRERESR